jgi:hypothetical protein
MKVIVFQLPSGTRPITLTPRGARPLRRTMLVVTAVSSRNTSLAGSSRPCSRIQRRRARATSARSRSAACRLFFNGHVMAVEKTRERAAAGSNSISSQLCNRFYQGQVRLLRYHRHDAFRLPFQWRNATPARLRRGAPTLIPALHPLDCRTHTDPKMLGGFMPGCACFNHLDDALTQITGVRLRHRYLPGSRINAKQSPIHNRLGIRFSPAGKRSSTLMAGTAFGAVAGLVGIEGGVVSGVFNLESSGVEAPDWRPRHDKH